MEIKKSLSKNIKSFLIQNEDKIVLITGFVLVSLISFGIGRLSAGQSPEKPPIIIDDSAVKCNTLGAAASTANFGLKSPEENNTTSIQEKIIGNKKSMIYHLPGGKFYGNILEENRAYFNSEEEAKKAGYRKSKL